ncbi:MAG: hypothetical protein NC320_08880 [Clostridium sp.]|nr:hypothetical protein [Clostridium sp.]MCM1547904.1 hypothetical protein [Ruminococcus sp.]
MSLFGKLFKNKKSELPSFMNDLLNSKDYAYVIKTAEFVTGNDPRVLNSIRECIDDPREFLEKHKERYSLWGLDPNDCDDETIVLTGFIDELSDNGYMFVADTSSDFDDFFDGITSLVTFERMKVDISEVRFDPKRNALEWCRKINESLKGVRQLCCIDIGGEDLNLVWLANETIEELVIAVENTEISIEAVGIKQY